MEPHYIVNHDGRPNSVQGLFEMVAHGAGNEPENGFLLVSGDGTNEECL